MNDDRSFPLSTFHRNGIAVVRQALAGGQLASLRQQALQVKNWALVTNAPGLRKINSPPNQRPADEYDPARTWGINEITREACFYPDIINVLADGPLGEAVSNLIEQPRAWGLKMLWAPQAVDYQLHWHRDIPWSDDNLLPYKPAAQDHLQYNVALYHDDSFMVVPGSHRRCLKEHERAAIAADRRGPLAESVRIKLEPGDAVIMDAHALHRGQAAAGAERLSLHYSVQAQWVPLLPWGEPAHFQWLCSERFQKQLSPATAACYARLVSAQRCQEQLVWLQECARKQGWDGQPATPPQHYS